MKHLVQTFIALFILNTSLMAQKGFEVQKEITINVSADQLWTMVGPGFIDVHKWASNVDHATGGGSPEFEGAVCSERFCDVDVKGFSKISEKLTNYSEKNMNLAYEVREGMPGFITKAVNDWTVVPVNDTQSKLVMKAEFGSKGFMGWLTRGMMEKKMNSLLDTVLNDAKIYAETGNVSSSKEKRMAELSRKMKKAA